MSLTLNSSEREKMSSAELIMVIFLIISGGCYAVLIVLFTIGWTRLQKHDIPDQANTNISIVIALRNEAANISRLIDQLVRLSYPEELLEIILVNDHSVDKTSDLIKSHQAFDRITLLELGKGSSGKKSAISYGVSQARGKLIVTTDADCRIHINWLLTIDTYYRQNEYRMLVGPVSIDYDSSWFAHFQALEFNSLQGSGGGAIGMGLPIMCNGANLIYEKNAFDKVEGFKGNEHIPGGDDMFLLEKFIQAFGSRSIGYIKECIAWNPDINTDRVSAMDMVMILREDRAKMTDKFNESRTENVETFFHDDEFLDSNWQKAVRKLDKFKSSNLDLF